MKEMILKIIFIVVVIAVIVVLVLMFVKGIFRGKSPIQMGVDLVKNFVKQWS